MKLNDYNDYRDYSVKIYDVSMAMSVLSWDQETMMPKNGNKFRAQQLSTLAKIRFELFKSFHFYIISRFSLQFDFAVIEAHHDSYFHLLNKLK